LLNGKTIKCFDVRVTGNAALSEYVLLLIKQKRLINLLNGYDWTTSLLIEIYTRQAQMVIVALGF
jgi:hypothetical protein